MSQQSRFSLWKWGVGLLTSLGIAGVGCHFLTHNSAPAHTPPAPKVEAGLTVEVTTPSKGGVQRTTTQSGTVLAYEQARLFAAVSGYLKELRVDIGDRVKVGQVLAILDVPELQTQVAEFKALKVRAEAHRAQMEAKVVTARAEHRTAAAGILQAEAAAKSALASRRFREKQLQRMKELFALKSIDERLVDESEERSKAADEAARAAEAAVVTARAQLETAAAKIEQANADVAEAKADIDVVQTRLDRAEVMVKFATVTSPYDGIITQRGLQVGDYVRAATESSSGPLLTVERTDRMRVVVQIPDRDAPFTDPKDMAMVELDALPGESFYPPNEMGTAPRVSRIAGSQNADTRLMRVEIDLDNKDGKIRQGMYGRVRILLDKQQDLLSLPSSCLVGKTEKRKSRVYVVRDGKLQLVPVTLGSDDGVRVAIRSGLEATDRVVLHPGSELSEGAVVSTQ